MKKLFIIITILISLSMAREFGYIHSRSDVLADSSFKGNWWNTRNALAYGSIQAAVDATPAGGYVEVPPGVWELTSSCGIKVTTANISIWGYGEATEIKAMAGCDTMIYANQKWFQLHNVYLNGNYGQATYGILLGTRDDSESRIINNTIYYADTGISYTGFRESDIIAFNVIKFCYNWAINIVDLHDANVVANQIEKNGSSGGGAIRLFSTDPSGASSNCVFEVQIVANDIEWNPVSGDGWGIWAYGIHDCPIVGNIIERNGVMIRRSFNIPIADNASHGCRSPGDSAAYNVVDSSMHVSLVNNGISRPDEGGIYVDETCYSISITNNSISGDIPNTAPATTGIGIQVKSPYTQVNGNEVTEMGLEGIKIDTSYCQINDNTVIDNGSAVNSEGIELTANADFCVVNDNTVFETRAGGSRTQTYGIYIASDSNVVTGNMSSGHITSDYYFNDWTTNNIMSNWGYTAMHLIGDLTITGDLKEAGTAIEFRDYSSLVDNQWMPRNILEPTGHRYFVAPWDGSIIGGSLTLGRTCKDYTVYPTFTLGINSSASNIVLVTGNDDGDDYDSQNSGIDTFSAGDTLRVLVNDWNSTGQTQIGQHATVTMFIQFNRN